MVVTREHIVCGLVVTCVPFSPKTPTQNKQGILSSYQPHGKLKPRRLFWGDQKNNKKHVFPGGNDEKNGNRPNPHSTTHL